jgi:F-type H+-transporting ATPase subunit delta
MAELSTAARPYAKALFQLAVDESRLLAWSATMGVLAQAAGFPEVQSVIGSPALTRPQLAALLCDALQGKIDREGENLVRLLAENGRLQLLPLIRDEFETLKAEAEKRAEVQITTAVAVDAAQQAVLRDAIKRRLQLEVQIDWKTDPSLIAGALIRAGDLVIDGSVSGELDRLRNVLVA